MPRNFLIVTESFTFGGLETQITGEITQLKKLGHNASLAVGRNYREDSLPPGVDFLLKDLPIGPDATRDELFAATHLLISFIRDHKTDCIHCHPFTSFLPALFASQNTGIKFSYTLHGPASLDAIYGPFYEFLVRGILFHSASLVTCVSEEVYSMALADISENRLLLLPNSVDLERIQPVQAGDPNRWLIVSRLDAFKVSGIKILLSYVKEGLFREIDIIGDGPAADDLMDFIQRTPELSSRVRMLGHKNNVVGFFEGYGGVAGMGRVILEAGAANIPSMLLGYDGPKGLMDIELAARTLITNFSGRGSPTIGVGELRDQVRSLRESPDTYKLRNWVTEHHNETRIWADFVAALEKANSVNSPITMDLMDLFIKTDPSNQASTPYLFDESLRDEVDCFLSTQHYRSFSRSIFEKIMTADRKQAESLSYGPIAERDQKITSLSHALLERDQKITDLNHLIDNQQAEIAFLRTQVADIFKSTSWSLTRPVRFAKRFYQNPRSASREIASLLTRLSSSFASRTWAAAESLFTKKSTRLMKEISKKFDIPVGFVELYRLQGHGPIDWNRSDWQDFYEHLPPLQMHSVPFAMSTVIRGRDMLALITSHSPIHHKNRFLDVGTGYGGFLRAAKEIGFEEVAGVELQPHLVALAKKNVAGIPGAQVFTGDFIKDDFSQLGTFDLITCNDVIEHVDDPELAIQKMAGLLSDDGTLCFEVPNKDCITSVISDGHFLIFGITLLAKNEAAEYYSLFTGAKKSVYLFEMGEMYDLNWYCDRLAENSLSPFVIDTHLISSVEHVPQLVADLKEAYRKWQKEVQPKLDAATAENVSVSVERYLKGLENDYLSLGGTLSIPAFQNKYLRSFWTIIATRKTVAS